ncbi:MAG TPA: antitoxin family protein [Chloroflexia bacterium]|nr:antitoxin family protein [Chloroflexia bacterium]
MQYTVEVVYEKGVFRLVEPQSLPLEEGQLVRIIKIEAIDSSEKSKETNEEIEGEPSSADEGGA